MRCFLFLILLIPLCSGLWQRQPKPFKLIKDRTDTCDFENSTCDITYHQASDWFRGHEHKWIRWFRLRVSDFISNNFAEYFQFPPNIEWVRLSGSNISDSDDAPHTDHSTKTPEGHYMYLHPDLNEGFSVSILLQTRQYQSVLPHVCLRYWYQIRGDATMMLAVVVKNEAGQEVKIIQPDSLRTGIADRTTVWKEAIHTLDVPVTQYFKIAIIGAVRDFRENFDVDSIAIDDIHVKLGRCRQHRTKAGVIKLKRNLKGKERHD